MVIISSTILVLLIIFTGIVASSRNSRKISDWLNEKNSTWLEMDSLTEFLKSKYENISVNNLSEYDFSQFNMVADIQNYAGVTTDRGSILHSLYHYNQELPIENIQIIDENTICVVYKLDKDGENIYAYMIFRRSLKDFDVSKNTKKAGTYEIWENIGEYYFASEFKSFDDYSHIEVGNHISKEYSAVFFMNTHVFNGGWIDCESIETVILLKDGILTVTLGGKKIEKPNINELLSEWTVQDIKFYPYGSTENVPENYSILKNGFVPEFP